MQIGIKIRRPLSNRGHDMQIRLGLVKKSTRENSNYKLITD